MYSKNAAKFLEQVYAFRQLKASKIRIWGLPLTSRSFTTESSQDDTSATGLPLAQRCKNLLAGNWRGQVTIANASAPSDGTQPRVASFLADYASPRGLMPPAILLHRQASKEHLENLKHSSLASITIGRTDPPELVQRVHNAGMRLPCLSILGDLVSMQRAELGYFLRRAQKVSSRLPGWPLDWESRAADPNTVGLSVDIQQIRYVEMTGAQHEVSLHDTDGAFVDPLATGLGRLLSGVNSSTDQASALRSFCAAYMGTVVTEAIMTQADRRGFTVLAMPSPEFIKDPELWGTWREFRFVFSQDISSVETFMSRLQGMQQEAEAMLSRKKSQ